MNATIEVLRNESKRLRSLADRMDAFAFELEGKPPPGPEFPLFSAATNGGSSASARLSIVSGGSSEFKGMTQHAAILRSLEVYGPQTTRELYIRLNSGGMSFKKPTYISSLLARLKNVVERTSDNRIKLKPSPPSPA